MMSRAVIAAICVALGRVAASAQHPGAGATIASEAMRIEKDKAALGDQAEGIADGLARVKDAVAKDRLFFALDELQEPWTIDAAMMWANAHSTIKTSEQFSAEWRVGEPALGAPSAHIPAAVEAIAASNAAKAPATWRASLPYSEDAGMNAGLYYLGEAQSFAAFAAFCRSLPFERHGTMPSFKPMSEQIASLEAEVAGLYDKAQADTKPRFIRVSVGLKIAHTLDEHKDYGASLYQYLTAKYRASVAVTRDAPAGDVRERLDAMRAKLAGGADHSIAELFLERAAYLLDTKDPSAARSAGVIADTVLPAYLKLVQR